MVPLAIWQMAWRLFRRDWMSGELRLLALALVVAVTAVCSVGFLADRVSSGLNDNAGQVLGADLLYESDTPIEQEVIDQAHAASLQTAKTWQFPSMVTFDSQSRLASVKVVSEGYPLKGTVTLQHAGSTGTATMRESVQRIPPAGTVWVDPALLAQLQAPPQAELRVGMKTLRVAALIENEPDRNVAFVNIAPRLMMNEADLQATGLLVPGSRVKETLLMAGAADQVSQLRTWLQARPAKGRQIIGTDSARPEIRASLDRAEQFLSLVSVLSVMIASVAIALAARRFSARHQDGLAVMRSLGATQGTILRMVAIEFLLIATFASITGVILGLALHYVLMYFLAGLIPATLPAVSWVPGATGLLTGWVLAFGFCVIPVLHLSRVPPLKALRRELDVGAGRPLVAVLVGVLVWLGLLLLHTGNAKLALISAGGFIGAMLICAAMAWVILRLLGRLRHALVSRPVLRFALAGLVNRRGMTVVQICALTLGIMIILLLGLLRTDLLAAWQNNLPADAPNRFLINIQQDQKPALNALFEREGLGVPVLDPMVRGRLIRIGDKDVDPATYESERTQRLAEREFNLSWLTELPSSNRIAAGRWLDPKAAEVSFEDDIARQLGVSLNDEVTFDVAGELVTARVTSLRTVKWDSMQVNFFAILSPAALQDKPATWITAFHLPEQKAAFTQDVVSRFPNITVFDVSGILRQLQSILDSVTAAVQFLFIFTLAAGVVVLSTAFLSTQDERRYEAGLLRAMGATSRQLDQAQRSELIVIGVMSGTLAAAFAILIAQLLAEQVFDISLSTGVMPWVSGIVLGLAASWLGGKMALRAVKNTPPLLILRSAE